MKKNFLIFDLNQNRRDRDREFDCGTRNTEVSVPKNIRRIWNQFSKSIAQLNNRTTTRKEKCLWKKYARTRRSKNFAVRSFFKIWRKLISQTSRTVIDKNNRLQRIANEIDFRCSFKIIRKFQDLLSCIIRIK